MFNKLIHKLFGVRLISSQSGEDLIIDSFCPTKIDGFYVEVGANHPVKHSNTFLFYAKGWHGVTIEPNPSNKWLFRLVRPRDTHVVAGIGQSKKEMNFFVFQPNTLSTFDQKSAKEYQKMGHPIIDVKSVPIIPLSEILEQHVGDHPINILSVDTEGFDLEVLESNNWVRFRPRFIILETLEYRANGQGQKLNDIYDPYLDNIGYIKVADTHINTIYEKSY